MNDTKHYQIRSAIDPKIIGRSELPLSVQIKDKEFLEYRKKHLDHIEDYFAKGGVFDEFPQQVVGKMYQRKKEPIDIMDLIPFCIGIEYVVSEKVKQIFEKLQIDRTEYHIEDLKIEGYNSKFYFLFIPILPDSKYIDFAKSVFWNVFAEKPHTFGSFIAYKEDKVNRFRAKELYVNSELHDRDIIKLQSSRTHFSSRILEAFEANGIIGYDIIRGGDFKVDLNFDTD